MAEAKRKALRAKKTCTGLAALTSEVKDKALMAVADALAAELDSIKSANEKDMAAGKKAKLSSALLDRLLLTDKRIEAMALGVREIASLPDPIGAVVSGCRRPNGMVIEKVRVPLGLVGIIYEARPNVTADAAALCLKSGNAVILRGGKEAINSNVAIASIIRDAIKSSGVPADSVQIITSTDRAEAQELMGLNGIVDVLIPRGGQGLIKSTVLNAKVPVIETGVGNCHTYIDDEADMDMARKIAFNAKVQRPGVCNAMETLLVHKAAARRFLPVIARDLVKAGVEIRGCPETVKILKGGCKKAAAADWAAEYLDLILAVRVVEDMNEAIEHIARYSTGHSECIVTRSLDRAREFAMRVDAADIFINASTRLADGGVYGLGAEIGISTQKLHARGPMGVEALTSTKYVVFGDGHIRQ